jgi:hypothetical protein
LLPIVYSLVLPTPFEYRGLPFAVCDPHDPKFSVDPSPENCTVPVSPFHPGDVIPFVIDRCATEAFARSANLPYVVSRNVVNDNSGTRIILPSLSTEIPAGGCDRDVTFAHQLPESIADGRYYLEGIATVYGRFRTVNAYFRTQTFFVAKT